MIAAAEFARISPTSFVWHRYDPQLKADVFSTGFEVSAGMLLIDPISVDAKILAEWIGSATISGVVVTNGNHGRASLAFAETFGLSIFLHHDAQAALNLAGANEVTSGSELFDEITVVRIEGAAPGEIALHNASDGGTAIVGDALINFGAHDFGFLPAKYCSDAKLMRRSLRQLLDYQFERILFAHGFPILARARARLEALLDQAG